jgi:N-acetylglucosaminyldiphosphoundecaprenol N-acetyl-beta-D-mannosaminyltransferase
VATQAIVLARSSIASIELTQSGTAPRERVELGGIFVDRVDLGSAVDRIDGFLRSGASHQVVTVNLDFLAIARQNSLFSHTLNRAHLAVADGMPLVWLSRIRGQTLPERVTGVDLVDECCRLAIRANRGVFLLGAGPGVAATAARTLETRFPGLQIAGTYSPPVGAISRRENDRIVRTIRSSQPGFLFVALGAPRQDLWIRANLARLEVPVAMGVGCVFDVLAGGADRAPTWMQRAGLEWAYRLSREPGRLWRRYLLQDAPLMGHLVIQSLLGIRSVPRNRLVVRT